MANEKLIFPIGFDLEEGVKEASKEWKSTYQKQLQKAIDDKPLKAKIELETKGLDLGKLKEFNKISKEMVAASKANAKIQRDNIAVQERQRLADERTAAAHERTLAAVARRRKAEEGLNHTYRAQSNYLSRLVQRMVAYASIAQAFSLIRNIRDVTAEFELQRVALGSIIGDLNEANAMFEQIKAAAVKSPFQIKELVTYTKQLAAYKIESDELFETTQRLADISAGLGVGMERLVLAYGQIRATGYLRASEVRQLTEAGIPIVEELAKKMSQLRGKTVSAAEVMGMISERAISFGMVKEVFDDMTSAGGMFYKMQEKQAETLAGQWSNLQDSIAIMYEEIGNTEGVNNAMKGMIGLVKSLAENWRVVGDVVVWSVGAALGYAKVVKPISELVKKMVLLNKAERAYKLAAHWRSVGESEWARQQEVLARAYRRSATALRGFGGALKSIGSFIKANWVGMLITAVTALVSWLISARQEANRLNKELEKIGTEGALQADQSVRNFERLAKAISESADGSAKQTEALEEMKRAYGEFLPSQDKSIVNLMREKDGYDAITQAIREKIALQTQEQKLNTIASEYGSQFTKWEDEIKGWHSLQEASKEEISLFIADIKNAVNEGLLSSMNDLEDNKRVVGKIYRDITGGLSLSDDELKRLFTGGTLYKGAILELIKVQESYNEQIQDVEQSMESATGSLGKYTQAYKDFKEELKDVTGTGKKFSFEWNESKTKAEIKAYNKFVSDLLTKERLIFNIGDTIDFEGLYRGLGDNYPQLKQVITKIQGEYEKLVPKDLEKLIKEQFSTLATKYGASLDELQHYFKSADQSTQDWVKTLKDAKTEIGNQIFDAKKLDKGITALESQKQVIEEMITAWDNSDKAQKSAEQALKDELAAVEKIYKRYQDLRKLKSETDTQSILAKEFEGVSLTTLSKAYSPEQMIEVYQKALAEAQRLGKKDLVLEIQTKIGEFNVANEQRKLEKHLKELSDKISRTKTAKEFFDRMLGMTGDKEFSATLTMNVYGEGGDLDKELAKQTIEQLETAFEGVDISSAIDKASGKVDYAKLAPFVEQLPEKAKTNAQSLVDAGMKANADWLIDLQKTYQKAFTFEERRTQVMEQEAQKRREIEESTLSNPLKKQYTEASEKRERERISAINLEEFKESSDYLKIFKDLDELATPTIERLIDRLREFIATNKELNATDLKNLTEQLDKLEEGLINRNPYDNLIKSVERLRVARQKLSATSFKDEAEYTDALDEQENAYADIEKALSEMRNEYGKAEQTIRDFADALGIAEDSDAGIFLNGIADAFGTVQKAIIFADIAMKLFDGTIKAFLVSNPIGWIALVAGGLVGLFRSIANAKVRRANREIERQQQLLDQLAYSYERLGKAQEKAFGMDYISNYEQRLANLQAQQEAYLKQADAERSKGKKSDSNKIKEYEKQERETADAIKDMQSEVAEHILGTDLASAARDFAQSWIEAYKEFGSTADAMKSKFQDMIQNMIVESFAARVIQTALEPIFDSIDAMSKDGVLDVSEASKIAEMTNLAVGNIDVGMTNLMNALSQAGISVRGMGSDLTGISRDIATASEESILGLAAGINTQNFYISQVPTKLDTIIGLLRGENLTQGSAITLQDLVTIQNQHLSHLPSIAQHTADTVAECKQIVAETRRTADALERVIKPRGTQATHVVNTSL